MSLVVPAVIGVVAALALFAACAYTLMLVWLAWDWGKSEGYWPHPYPDIGIQSHLEFTPRWLWPLYHRAYRSGQAKRERERNKPADPRLKAETNRILHGE